MWEVPLQNEKLHSIGIPSFHDVKNLIDNGSTPENVVMLTYWFRKLEEKCKLLDTNLTFPDDVIILGALELELFEKDLQRGNCV